MLPRSTRVKGCKWKRQKEFTAVIEFVQSSHAGKELSVNSSQKVKEGRVSLKPPLLVKRPTENTQGHSLSPKIISTSKEYCANIRIPLRNLQADLRNETPILFSRHINKTEDKIPEKGCSVDSELIPPQSSERRPAIAFTDNDKS